VRDHSILDLPDWYRRPRTERRTLTGSPRVPSQDVSRYQAKNMPPPTYDLGPTDVSASLLTILILTLAVVATGAGIIIIERIGTWLSP